MTRLIIFLVSGMLFMSSGANAQVKFYEHYKYCSSNYDLFPVIVKCSLDRRSEYLKGDSWARAQRSAMGDHFDAFLIVTEEKLKNKKITAAEAKLLVTEKLMNLEMQIKRNSNRDDDDDDFTSFMRNLGAVTDDLQRREQQRIDQYYNRGGGSGTTCTTQKVGQSYKTVCN
jgi:hypothetical protein